MIAFGKYNFYSKIFVSDLEIHFWLIFRIFLQKMAEFCVFFVYDKGNFIEQEKHTMGLINDNFGIKAFVALTIMEYVN